MSPPTNQLAFLSGHTGEMGKLTRDFDWSKTSVGSVDTWSHSMRTLIRMMLTSRFPMLIFWGGELITFYNDAFIPSLGTKDGKHPSSLGQKGQDSWSESWSEIGPMIDGIMKGGAAVFVEDHELPIRRYGELGYAHWTYSFSPLIDDEESVSGILVTCLEVTKKVEAMRLLRRTTS